MSALQRRLTEFLECDLAHSLGSHSKSASLLDSLRTALESDSLVRGQNPNYGSLWKGGLLELVDLSASYAARLDRLQDSAVSRDSPNVAKHSIGLHRHPLPPSYLPLRPALSLGDRKEIERRAKSREGDRFKQAAVDPTRGEVIWPRQFYLAAIAALEHESLDETNYPNLCRLREAVLQVRSPGDTTDDSGATRKTRREKYAARYRRRLGAWSGTFQQAGEDDEPLEKSWPSDPRKREILERIAGLVVRADLGAGEDRDLAVRQPLPLFVLRALVDGHLGLHVADAFNQRPLHRVLADDNEPAAQHIPTDQVRQSVELLTFVRTAVRVAPHMFAEGASERVHVTTRSATSWQNVVPSRAMWIGTQVGVLALYRRAHAYMLLGDRRKAYNDFHKLQGDIRDAQRRLRSSPLHVRGAHEFLQSLDALSNYHMGELYRSDRQFHGAALHLGRARSAFNRLHAHEQQRPIIANARWLVQLYLSLGKTHYELGRHKSALIAFLQSWKALLELIAEDTGTEVEPEPLAHAIEQLTLVEDEPLLYVSDVKALMEPIVEQIEASYVDRRFTALASEVLLRIGQVLLVTRVDRADWADRPWPVQRSRLAAKIIIRAARLDPNSTLGASGLFRLFATESLWRDDPSVSIGEAFELERDAEVDRLMAHVAKRLVASARSTKAAQWAGGQDLLESYSRTVDLGVVAQVASADNAKASDEIKLARRLLLGFLTHTDSIEARRSQVHRYLTEPRDRPAVQEPSIEFACLRRYSSAFPLIPRAENSRSHGGGYFVRLVPGDLSYAGDEVAQSKVPVGIVVDPGTSFLECFFRSPYSLANIDGIIVTHDHVDHASMLEPLLAALHEMSQLHPGSPKRPWIAGNDSVVARLHAISQYRLRTLGEPLGDGGARLYRLTRKKDLSALADHINSGWRDVERRRGAPKEHAGTTIKLTAVSSRTRAEGRDWIQHADLMNSPSVGVLFELESQARATTSVYVASDMPRSWSEGKSGCVDQIKKALQADVVVGHVSTVPLTELRQMASFADASQRLSETRATKKRTKKLHEAAQNHAKKQHGSKKKRHKAKEALIDARSAHDKARAEHEVARAAERAIRSTLAMWEVVAADDAKLRRLRYAYWLSTWRPRKKNGKSRRELHVRPLERGSTGKKSEIALERWRPRPEHLYLSGLLNWAHEARGADHRTGRLLVLGELSEELGSFRRRVAHEINTLWRPKNPKQRMPMRAITSDLGLRVLAVADRKASKRGRADVRVSCSSCELDNDCAEEELWHHPQEIREVCIKGENEGIFYNCGWHDPGRAERGEEAFIEKFERYDVFGA